MSRLRSFSSHSGGARCRGACSPRSRRSSRSSGAPLFVAFTHATYSAPPPRYVTDAFERYLVCGDFSQGFIRCHCDSCQHDVLVPFSCKQRGLCPSSGARRMCDAAATITDRILPNVPLRQWVSLPFELRGLAATKTALGRIFASEIARTTKRIVGEHGAETGAVSFPQR